MSIQLKVLFIIGSFLVSLPRLGHAVEGTTRIWFSPDNETPDLLAMFTRPNSWRVARSHIKVFKLGPQHFELQSSLKINSFRDLENVGAFQKLKRWGIALASEEGSVKEWDCTGQEAARITLRHIQNIRSIRANINLIAMDEPLVSGLGPCKLSLTDIAVRTHGYIDKVIRDSGLGGNSGAPLIGDIEPYPHIPVGTLQAWIDELSKTSTRLDFFHLDINLHYLHVHPEINVSNDLREIQQVLAQEGIPFGVIIWSGHDPVDSDAAYYKDAMELVRLLKTSVHLPIDLIFQSWVHRSPIVCYATHNNCGPERCTAKDPVFCGEKSIPLNLPEGDPHLYTHTRLVNDSLAVLGER